MPLNNINLVIYKNKLKYELFIENWPKFYKAKIKKMKNWNLYRKKIN